jgi:hypothetical protein
LSFLLISLNNVNDMRELSFVLQSSASSPQCPDFVDR